MALKYLIFSVVIMPMNCQTIMSTILDRVVIIKNKQVMVGSVVFLLNCMVKSSCQRLIKCL